MGLLLLTDPPQIRLPRLSAALSAYDTATPAAYELIGSWCGGTISYKVPRHGGTVRRKHDWIFPGQDPVISRTLQLPKRVATARALAGAIEAGSTFTGDAPRHSLGSD